MEAEANLNLYLAAQERLLDSTYDELSLLTLNSNNLLRSEDPDSYVITDRDVVDFEKELAKENGIFAQMTLGYRYSQGIGGLSQSCQTSFAYYEPVAHLTAEYVLRTHGLDVVEKKKLKLGSHVIDNRLQIDDSIHVEVQGSASQDDIEELMDFKGAYGNADSLVLKALKSLHSDQRSKVTYERAYLLLNKALEIEPKNGQANYYVGLMSMLGQGIEQDIEAALYYFEQIITAEVMDHADLSKALNAQGYIYFYAPDHFD